MTAVLYPLVLSLTPLSLPAAVISSFRGAVSQGLVLEIGETVQILEKSEGKARDPHSHCTPTGGEGRRIRSVESGGIHSLVSV